MTGGRASVGAAGERVAAWWLTEQGLRLEAANVEGPDGEIDLVFRDGDIRVAVEVRAITGAGDPIDAVDHAKRTHVRGIAKLVGASRVDFVGVALRSDAVEIHWVPG